MTTAHQLKAITQRLSLPPFSKTINVIQLHDEYSVLDLLLLISQVSTVIDDRIHNPMAGLSVKLADPQDLANRLGDFLRVLKFPTDWTLFREDLIQGRRGLLLEILLYLVTDLDSHKKRAYLYPYLSIPEIPPEFEQDEDIMALMGQINGLQEQFKETHKFMESVRETGHTAADLKREIQQMEEEKQQISSKLYKLKSRVDAFPKKDQWLQTAKNLRLEQQNETMIADRIRDQKTQVANVEKTIQKAQQSLKEVKNLFVSGGPTAYLAKMNEDVKVNKYLATENLPMMKRDLETSLSDVTRILSEPSLTEADLTRLEDELKKTNEEVSRLSEQKQSKASSGDSKITLFRQQATIIARKKEGTATQLADLQETVAKLTTEVQEKVTLAQSSTASKMLKGEEFKKYVSELRGKSALYKGKKAELSALSTEYGVLQRTEELLKTKEAGFRKKVHSLEAKSNVVGYHSAQETLEKVSEKKAEVDEAKGKTLQEVSQIVSELLSTINAKKSQLAPVIQELRQVRQENTDLEVTYFEKKRAFDAILLGLETETAALASEVGGYRQDIQLDASRYHHLQILIGLLDTAQDRVLGEMKAYIGGGGDPKFEQLQLDRGFKSYRDLYTKKIMEADHATKQLKETQRTVKASHEERLKQVEYFTDLRTLMGLKATYNKGLLQSAIQSSTMERDRLVGRKSSMASPVAVEDRLVL